MLTPSFCDQQLHLSKATAEEACVSQLAGAIPVFRRVPNPDLRTRRKQAEIAALDKELDARRRMSAAQAAEIEAVFASEELLKRRGAVISEELNASLEVMTVQSFLVETEVRRQRLLHHIAAVPYGFNR